MSDSIQSQGGKARAESLSGVERRAIAAKAAAARWESKNRVVASYSVPLGVNVANICITGEGELTAEDFETLLSYVQLFSKQRKP